MGAKLTWAFKSLPHLSSCMVSCLQLQEEDVIGVLNSTDIAQLLPIGDRILVEVRMLYMSNTHSIHDYAVSQSWLTVMVS